MGKRYKDENIRKMLYIFGITLILTIFLFIGIISSYNKNLSKKANENLKSLGAMNAIVSNDDLVSTSFSSDQNIKEVKEKMVEENTKNVVKEAEKVEPQKINKEAQSKIVEKQEEVIPEPKEELCFEPPLSGEIIKDFAKDTLIYSNTLEEWCTHPGIDIRGERTAIVVASEKGVVKAIKNDPRYGLSVIVEHANGFKTVYSNLLTAEFVKEGENVEKGQTLGTIGDTANFEISDDSHLHFEMYKDGENVNPTIYLK